MHPTSVRPKLRARATRWLGLAAAAVVITGCASMNVNSFTERQADFSRFHTFTWGPADAASTGDPRLDSNRFFEERVREQVEKGLERRGFEKSTAAQPDLLVHYHANFGQEVDSRNLDQSSNYCATADCRPFVYEAGTLFVDLVDPRTNTLVWRGWAEGSVDGVIDNQQWMEEHIDTAVAKILERLPRRL